ncbi:HAMP domain-containing histidine kinase [Paenibacillus sp. J5C_2022]|uniref:sensor histidine kinase n=1 Tax=Paenibacillus sp. J5C2022 TaxID=2977129 RepID=UPI0021D06A6C|nr:HAMP domain-containing sensor histidine kinase [Paenibacillus sp. J5C2022]MCU6707445.1 HAMP domain-containing histidine kinase [Paenibacillus sp. J5C2022]
MKLLVRLNLSIGLLIVCILAITVVLIYPLLLNTLIEGQRKDMREQGSILMKLTLPETSAIPLTPAKPVQQLPLQHILIGSKMEAIITSPANQVLYSTLPEEKANALLGNSGIQNKQQNIWQSEEDDYIVETIPASAVTANGEVIPAISLTVAMPLGEIKEMWIALFQRMLLILVIGAALTFLISMLITRRLVTPLTRLRQELKKVETRRFSEVKLIKADGEIGEVAQSVSQLAAVLEQYEKSQKQFFQNASHELKTPLMSIQGYAEGMKDGIFTGEKAEKGLGVIVKECERLKSIVTEMILLAKLESEEGIFRTEQIKIETLIQELTDRLHPLLLTKGLELQTVIADNVASRHIAGDREKLLQALLNIAANAARYAKKTIWVRAWIGEQNVHLEIADDGEGIPESLLPRLFQRFAKGAHGETGLGLAISRAIVERSRGQITASNRKEGGASFRLQFPNPGAGS